MHFIFCWLAKYCLLGKHYYLANGFECKTGNSDTEEKEQNKKQYSLYLDIIFVLKEKGSSWRIIVW